MISSQALGLSPIVCVFVSSKFSSSERRLDRSLLLPDLKVRLSVITGVPAASMKLALYSDNAFVCNIDDDTKMLGFYPLQDYMTLKVVDLNPSKSTDYGDMSQVEKIEMSDKDYQKRTGNCVMTKTLCAILSK